MLLSGDRNIYGKVTVITSNNGYGNSPSTSTTTSQGWGVPLSTNIPPTPLPLVVGWTDKMHQKAGNVALGDGSTQQLSTPKLAEALRQTGDTTTSPGANTILFP
jgi:hypothetical protein